MDSIMEKPRSIPVLEKAQVLVVGGGPSGIAAALASARSGADTLLLERYGCFGGVITQVGIEAVAWYRHEGKVNEAGGILREMEDTALRMGASVKECQSDSQALDPEMFKYVCDQMLQQAGIRLLLAIYAVAAIVEDGLIRGVITESKSGRTAILADRVIDCTGDGDIMHLAGALYKKASRQDLMSVTELFSCRGVNTEQFTRYVQNDLKPTYRDWGGECWAQQSTGKEENLFSPYLEKPFVEARKRGDLVIDDPSTSIGGTWSTITPEGEVTQLNLVFMRNIDCTDVRDTTKAHLNGRRYCIEALRILREQVPGLQNARLRNFGMALGTRESHLLDGRYTLTKEDVFNQTRFEDSIAIFPEFIDVRGYLVLPTTGRYYQIPYRALVPKNVDNLLVAGRCISGEPIAHTSFRNMSCCMATGQAAGTAAALSVQSHTTTADVHIPTLQQMLEAQGVWLR